jgi:hypothetical protein
MKQLLVISTLVANFVVTADVIARRFDLHLRFGFPVATPEDKAKQTIRPLFEIGPLRFGIRERGPKRTADKSQTAKESNSQPGPRKSEVTQGGR